MAHWVWGGGWLADHGTLDWAGGVPVEMASGFSAFAAAIVVGARKDYGRQAVLPHNSVYVLVGAGLLWFGWFGFNGGSGAERRRGAVLSFTNTLLAPAATLVVWIVLDYAARREGDGDRRRDGDHRRLRADHAGGGLHQPDVGDPARRARRGPELPLHRLAAADAARRDARRARRARASAASSGSSSSASSRSSRWNGISDGAALRRPGPALGPGAGRARRAGVRVRRHVRPAAADRARHAAARQRARRGHGPRRRRSTARRRTRSGEGAILVHAEPS